MSVDNLQYHCVYDALEKPGLLKPHPKNTNKHPEQQVALLAKIIAYQGWRHPIIISSLSGLIVAGHGRWMAAKYAKWDKVPVVYQPFVDKNQEYAFLESDNHLAELAEHDMQEMIENLKEFPDLDLEMLGIPDFKLEDDVEILPSCDEDEIPELKQDPISKLGDIYRLGNHRLMCGDSTLIGDVEKLMDGQKASMVFTDPPYGISYRNNHRVKPDKFEIIKNDQIFLDEWINVLPVVSVGWVFIWTTWKVLDKWIEITSSLGKLSNLIIWDKGGGGIGDLSKTFSTDYEMALVYNRNAEILGKRIGSIWAVGKDRHIDYLHPTQKPVELGQMAIENCVLPMANILDLFGGSGSTLIACEKTKRKCFMMELDPRYVDVIIARWEKYTGKKAELIDNPTNIGGINV